MKLTSHKTVFHNLIQFSSELDGNLKRNLTQSTVFKGISKTIKNELLKCLLEVYNDGVCKEIEHVDYVASVIDETTELLCLCQLVTVLHSL